MINERKGKKAGALENHGRQRPAARLTEKRLIGPAVISHQLLIAFGFTLRRFPSHLPNFPRKEKSLQQDFGSA
jgi:hypothetical protein